MPHDAGVDDFKVIHGGPQKWIIIISFWKSGSDLQSRAHLAKKRKIPITGTLCVRSMWKHFSGAEGENKRDQSQTVYKQRHDKHEKAYF